MILVLDLRLYYIFYLSIDKAGEILKKVKDPNVVSGLLKLWFRELKEAICTWELYECFLAAIGSPL